MLTINEIYTRACHATRGAEQRCIQADRLNLARIASQTATIARLAYNRGDDTLLKRVIKTACSIGKRVRGGVK